MVEINKAERKKEKRIKRNEDNLRDLRDNVKCPNIGITGVPEEDKKKGHEKILEEIIVENFPKMGKEIVSQVQETQKVPNKINPRLICSDIFYEFSSVAQSCLAICNP